MASVYITVPNDNGWMHKHVHFAVMKMMMDKRHKQRHDCPTHRPYVHNLHKCMKDFLNGGEDFWLSIDADNPPMANPLDLIDLDLDIVGFPTPVWHSLVKGDQPWYLNAMDADAEKDGWKPHWPAEGLQRVDAIGSGCMLISRRVALHFEDQGPFMREWKDGLVTKGGDYMFSQRAIAAGFEIYAAFHRPCRHYNEVELRETIQAFQAAV
jgi:hypothetical protein